MKKIIGFCGIVCGECPAFIATQKDDDTERESVAKQWSEEYKHKFKARDINCDGCRSKEGRHIEYCNLCEIRSCAIEKEVENCAYCEGYICEKLNKFFNIAPHMREALKEIRKNL